MDYWSDDMISFGCLTPTIQYSTTPSLHLWPFDISPFQTYIARR